jgi:hypothetical protein
MIRKIAGKVLSEPAKQQLRRAQGKSPTDVARFAVRKVRRKRQARAAANRFRSSYNVFGRLAEVPAVRYSVLSDPAAARTLLDSPKGQELIASRSTPATTPMSSQFLGLLANQPERIAEFLERPDIRNAVRQSGVSNRVGTDWIRVALDLNDRRAVDILTDIAGDGVQTLMSNQQFVRRLLEYLADPSSNYGPLQMLLESLHRFDPMAIPAALPQSVYGYGSNESNGSNGSNGSHTVVSEPVVAHSTVDQSVADGARENGTVSLNGSASKF